MTEDLTRGSGEQIVSETPTAETVEAVSGGASNATLTGQAAIPVNPPPAGETVILQPQPGDRYQLNANPADVRIQVEGLNVVLAFDTNGDGTPDSRVVFQNLVEVAAQENPPVIEIGGQAIAANVLIGGALALAGEEATVETAAGAGALGGGGSTYDDDLGDVIALLVAQGIIPPTELAFGLLERIEIVPINLPEEAPAAGEEPCDCDEKLLKYLETWRNGEFAGVTDPSGLVPGDLDNTETGTGGNDALFGGFGPYHTDLLIGKGGNDLMAGLSGDDWLFGGDGDDLMFGDGPLGFALPSKDAPIGGGEGPAPIEELSLRSLDGSEGGYYDLLSTFKFHGDDFLFGGSGDDIMVGGGGEDWLVGNDGADVMVGDSLPSAELLLLFDWKNDPEIPEKEEPIGAAPASLAAFDGGKGEFLELLGNHAFIVAGKGMTDYNDILEAGNPTGKGEDANILVGDAMVTTDKVPYLDGSGQFGDWLPERSITLVASDAYHVDPFNKGKWWEKDVNAFNDLLIGDDGEGDILVGDAYMSDDPLFCFEDRGCYESQIDLIAESTRDFGDVYAFNDVICAGSGDDLIVGDAYLETGRHDSGNINLTATIGSEKDNYVGAPQVASFGFYDDNPGVKYASVEAFNDTIQGSEGDDTMIGDALLDGKGDINLNVGIPKDTDFGGNNLPPFEVQTFVPNGSGNDEIVFKDNYIGAFNDEMCPCEDDGDDLLVGDAALFGRGSIDLAVGLPPKHDLGKDTDIGAVGLVEEGGSYGPALILTGNCIVAFSDTLKGGDGSDRLIGDAYYSGSGRDHGEVDLFVGLSASAGDETGDRNTYRPWFHFNGNKVSAFNDYLGGGNDESDDLLVGDVLFEHKGKDVEFGGPISFEQQVESLQQIQIYNPDPKVHLEVALDAEGDRCEGGEVQNNIVKAFNDEGYGGAGNDTLIGDVYYHETDTNFIFGRDYYPTLNLVSEGCEAPDVLLEVGLFAGENAEVKDNKIWAYNDKLVGGEGDDLIVGDVYYQHETTNKYFYFDGGECGYPETFSSLASVLDYGYGDPKVELDVALGAFGYDAKVKDNEIRAYNDDLIGGEGEDTMVGDVFYENTTTDKEIVIDKDKDIGNPQIEEASLLALQPIDGGEGAPEILLNAGLFAGKGGEVEGNEIKAYNDCMVGGDGNDLMVGDVYYLDSYTFDGGEGGGDPVLVKEAFSIGGGYSDSNVVLHAALGAFWGGDVECNEVKVFNDDMFGGTGDDTMVGDVYYLIDGGEGGPGSVAAAVDLFASGKRSDVKDNEVKAYSDLMIGGEGDDDMVGDVWHDSSGEVELTVNLDGGEGGEVKDNSVYAFNDVIIQDGGEGGEEEPELELLNAKGGWFDTLMVGDVYFTGYYGEVDLEVNLEAEGRSNVNGNCIVAYSDYMEGADGDDKMVGDVYYRSHYWGEGAVYADVALEAEYGGDVKYNDVTAYSDCMEGGEGNDLMVGDVLVKGNFYDVTVDLDVKLFAEGEGSEVKYNSVYAFNDSITGDDGSDYYSDGDDKLVGDVLFGGAEGKVDLEVKIGEDGGANTENNDVYAFNDYIGGGEGNDLLVGDVLFKDGADNYETDVDLKALIDGDGTVGTENNKISAFNDSLYGGWGNDKLVGDVQARGWVNVNLAAAYLGHGHGNEIWAFNDYMDGGYGENELTGDVYHQGKSGDIDLLAHATGNGTGKVSAFNDTLTSYNSTLVGDVRLSAEHDDWVNLTALADGNGSSHEVRAFNDTLYTSGKGNSVLVGDVFDEGAGDLDLLAEADGSGDAPKTVEAFNDSITGGYGHDDLVGDVYTHGGSVNLDALVATSGSGDDNEGGSSHTLLAFSDYLNGNYGYDNLVGDLYGATSTDSLNASLQARIDSQHSGEEDNQLAAFNDTIYSSYNGTDYAGDDITGDVFLSSTNAADTLDLLAQIGSDGDDNVLSAFSDRLFGNEGWDEVVGDVRTDLSYGTRGAEIDLEARIADINGGDNGSDNSLTAFDDTLEGAGGNDILVGDIWGGAHTYYGGDGPVTDYDDIDIDLEANDDDSLSAFNDEIRGGDGGDLIVGDIFFQGSGGANHVSIDIDRGSGNGTVRAFSDQIDGDDGNDVIYGDFYNGKGLDSVGGGAFDPDITIFGSNGADDTFFADTINGGGGNDTIVGGLGDDTMTGGEGNDTFGWTRFDLQSVGDGDPVDIVKDFSSSEEFGVIGPVDEDVLDLSDLLDGATDWDGNLANLDDYLQLVQVGADVEVQIDTNGGPNNFETFIVLENFNMTGTSLDDLIANGNIVVS